MNVKERLAKEMTTVTNAAQNHLMKLHQMEAYTEIASYILDMLGRDAIFTPDVTYGDNSMRFYYYMRPEDSYKRGKVYDVLAWCVNNLEYDHITESVLDYAKIWYFSAQDEPQIVLTINHTSSSSCRMVETGEVEVIERPVLQLVCED